MPDWNNRPYDYNVSSFGKYIVDYVEKKLFYIDGSYNFVDVRDVAKGMVDLAAKWRSGGLLLSERR